MWNSIPSYRKYNYSPYSFHVFMSVSYYGDVPVAVTATSLYHVKIITLLAEQMCRIGQECMYLSRNIMPRDPYYFLFEFLYHRNLCDAYRLCDII
jgi:hypothetical protein